MTRPGDRQQGAPPDAFRVPDDLRGQFDRRMDQILAWAQSNDGVAEQSWLIEFFRSRLAGNEPPDPQDELVAALAESRMLAAAEGVLLTCEAARLVFANEIAREIIDQGCWLVVRDHALRGASADLDAQFRLAIREALAGDAREGDFTLRMRLDAAGNGGPLFLRFTTLRLPGAPARATPFVAVRMLRETLSLGLDGDCLIEWYGLSRAEARLAIAFANGIALTDYAGLNDVSINTVRTHFARIKAKLEAADQAAVVRKVLLVAAHN